jgi:hypothetical protein
MTKNQKRRRKQLSPPDEDGLCRVTLSNGINRDVRNDYGVWGDYRSVADRHTIQDRCACAYPDIIADRDAPWLTPRFSSGRTIRPFIFWSCYPGVWTNKAVFPDTYALLAGPYEAADSHVSMRANGNSAAAAADPYERTDPAVRPDGQPGFELDSRTRTDSGLESDKADQRI